MEWMLMPYRRYADFKGRSQRKEYWMFVLLYIIVSLVFFALMAAGGAFDADGAAQAEPGVAFWLGAGLFLIFVLGSLIPSLAVMVRRFHDQDKSGWFILLNFVPYVGGIILLVFMVLDGTKGANRFGPDPKDINQADVFS